MSIEKIKLNSKVVAEAIIEGLQEIKAKQITLLDLRNISSAVCDYFIICHGDSSTHVNGIAQTAEKYVRKEIKEKPWHKEGKENASWILLDYVDVVVHIFQRETREFYKLEELWADAQIEHINSED